METTITRKQQNRCWSLLLSSLVFWASRARGRRSASRFHIGQAKGQLPPGRKILRTAKPKAEQRTGTANFVFVYVALSANMGFNLLPNITLQPTVSELHCLPLAELFR